MPIPTDPRITPELQTSPTFRIRGLKALFYPDEGLRAEDCTLMQDVDYSNQRVVTKRAGTAKYNPNQIGTTTAVVGLKQQTYVDTSKTRIVAVAADKVYDVDTTSAWAAMDISGSVTITTGANNRCRFAYIDDKVIVSNGVNDIFQVGPTGNAATVGGSRPFNRCKDVIAHDGLLMVMGTLESATFFPSRLRWCDIDTQTFTNIDITSYPAQHVYDLYDDAAPIVGGVDNFSRALIFKADGVYPVSFNADHGLIEVVVDENNVRRGFSPVARDSIVARPEFAWVVCREGAYIVLPDFSVQHVTRDFRNTWEALDQTRIQHSVSFVRERQHQIVTLLTTTAATANHDLMLVWDWDTNALWTQRPTDEITYGASFLTASKEFDLLGTSNGYVLKGNDGDQDKDNGSDIDWRVRMAPNDLGFPGKTKTIVNLYTIVERTTTAQSFNLSVIRDQGNRPSIPSSLTVGSSDTWDDGVGSWDDGTTWESGDTTQLVTFVNRTAETVAPDWSGDSDVSIVGYRVNYMVEEN